MIRLTSALAAALILVSGTPHSRAEDDTNGGTTDGGLWVQSTDSSSGAVDETPVDAPPATVPTGPSILLGSGGCAAADTAAGGVLDLSFCPDPDEPAPVLTVGLIRNAFAELKLPAGTLVIQPPDGLTLVNFDTNFYTTSTEPIARTVTLLGRRVTLEATPSTFHWAFGDGERLTTSDPGAPYPDLRVTHSYLRKDTYRPSLGTTYTGRYRVGGGPWRQIPGTVTINGTGQALRAIEAQPRLVGY